MVRKPPIVEPITLRQDNRFFGKYIVFCPVKPSNANPGDIRGILDSEGGGDQSGVANAPNVRLDERRNGPNDPYLMSNAKKTTKPDLCSE